MVRVAVVQSCDQRGDNHKIHRIQWIWTTFLSSFWCSLFWGGEGMDQFLALGLVCTELHTATATKKYTMYNKGLLARLLQPNIFLDGHQGNPPNTKRHPIIADPAHVFQSRVFWPKRHTLLLIISGSIFTFSRPKSGLNVWIMLEPGVKLEAKHVCFFFGQFLFFGLLQLI